jgi:hypothetical protein
MAVVFIFGVGVFVGLKKADFSFKWAEEYHRNFGGPRGGFFGNFLGLSHEFPNGNGCFGQIISINIPSKTLAVKDASGLEKNILIDDKTAITYQRQRLAFSDLKMGETIVAIGTPKEGQIKAELIRVIPYPPRQASLKTQIKNPRQD